MELAIERQIKPRYASRNHEIIANIREMAGAARPIDPKMLVKRKAAEISAAMALIHGGDWRVQIDHDAAMVLVVRR